MVDFAQMKGFVRDPLVLESGEGIRVTDVNGKVYIDALSGVFTSNLGHANAELIEPIVAQMRKLAFGAPTMATSSAALRLVDRLLEILPSHYTTMKFLSGGSEATEAAIKLARQFHRQTGSTGRYKIVSHYRGYHGGTGNALAASGWADWKMPYEPTAPGFIHLATPDPDEPPFPAVDAADAARTYLKIAEETIVDEGPESIAAIITEPIMMSAGIVDPGDSYLRGLRALCDRYGILLIFDEIITGFGRTGQWFAAAQSGAWPDILCVGKGLTSGYSPLSAVFLSDGVAQAFWGEPEERVQFHAGHTYGGNPVACAAALAAIDYIRRHRVFDNVNARGAELGGALRELATTHPSVRIARGRGLLQGIAFSDQAQRSSTNPGGFGGAVAQEARCRGALLRASPWFVAFAPPLTTTARELDEIVDIVRESVAAAEAAAGIAGP